MLTDEHTQKLGLLNQLLIAGSQDQYVPSAHDREFLQRKFPNIYGTPKKTTPETRQLDIFGDHEKWKVKSTPNNHGMSIAHRDHTPNFRLDGIDRYITTDKHDPSQHDIPVDDYGRPIPSLKPTDLQIDKQNLPGNMIDPSLYDDADMLLSELNAEQLKILKTIPSDLNKRSPAERLKIMRDIHGKVMEKA